MKSKLFHFLRKKGYSISKPGITDRNAILYYKILDTFGIQTVIDIGANTGQYGFKLRKLGYRGNIYSFEPLSSAFSALKQNAADDALWHVFNTGLGNENGEKAINISENSVSSSFADMLPEHLKHQASSEYVGKETVKVNKLDDIQDQIHERGNNFLKIDVQGYEKNVLEGSENFIREKTSLIQLEMALTPLYKDEYLMEDFLGIMKKYGFSLYNLFPIFTNFETAQLLQVDGIFAKDELLENKGEVH